MARENRDFVSFRDEMNAKAPFAQMGRALNLVDPEQGEMVENLAVNEVLESMSASFPDLGEPSSQEMVDFQALLRAHLRPFLRVSDDPGLSMLDIVTHGATTDEEIARALKVYGIDLSNESDLFYASTLLDEAVRFYDEYVVANSRDLAKVAAQFRSHNRDPRAQDIFKIFRAAAGHEVSRKLIPQACGLLRIAMVIDHYKTHPRVIASERILEAVNHRLSCVKPLQGGGYNCNLSGDPHDPGIHIHEFRVREKDPFSGYAKLLHKPEVDVDEIRDLVGAMFVTGDPRDTLRLIYELFLHPGRNVFSPFLLDPRQSDQLTFDPQNLNRILSNSNLAEELVQSLSQGVSEEDFDSQDRNLLSELLESDGTASGRNEHSSRNFRVVKLGARLRQPIARPKRGQPRPSVIVPVEFQFLDLRTINGNRAFAPHEGYKDSQHKSVCRRVFEGNLQSHALVKGIR